MACSPSELVDNSKCLFASMSERQLLASIAYNLAVLAGESTDPSNLVADSKCLWTALNERQLLASIVYLQCQLAGG